MKALSAVLSLLGSIGAGVVAVFGWLRDKRLKKEGRRDMALEQAQDGLRREKRRDEIERDIGGLSPDELADRLRDPDQG